MKTVIAEKWAPPIIAGLMTGIIAVASNLWLLPAKEKVVAIFDEKRQAARELQEAFSRYLISLDAYQQHMRTMNDVDRSNPEQISFFKQRYEDLFSEFNSQTKELSYVLATSEIYFTSPVRKAIDEFRIWHNATDKMMTSLPPEEWPQMKVYVDWRQKIIVAVREEIVGDAE